MAISDLLYRIALARGGVGSESSLDKLNRTFQTIGGLGKQMSDYGAQQQANQLNALKLEEAKANIAKTQAENARTTQENKSYFSGLNIPEPGTITQDRQFGDRTVPRQVIAGSPSSPSESPILDKQVYIKSEPIIQTEQVSREQYEKTPFSKQIPYEVARMVTNKQFNEALGKYLFKPEPTNVKYLYDEDGNIVSQVPKGSTQLLPSTVGAVDPATGERKFTKKRTDVILPKQPVKQMSDKTKDIFSGLMDSLSAIETSAGYVSGDKVRVGEGTNLYKLSNIPGAGLVRGLAGTPEENELMANLTKAQASFYKAQTGAQRGMKEIAFLSPAMPQAGSQNKENFLATAKSSAKSIADNFIRAYRLAEKQGNDMSEYKPTYDQILSAYGEPSPIGGINRTEVVETSSPTISNEQIIAENESGVRIQSTDGGKTWKPIRQ